MTGLVRKATLFSVCGMLIAGSAMAFVPNCSTSIFPCAISLVGTSGTTADAAGQFTIVVKDVAGNGIPNAAIVIDFTACCSDIKLSGVQNGAGVTIDGTHKKINVTADASGTAVIRIQGVASKAGPLAGQLGCATLTANGVPLAGGIGNACGLPPMAVSVFDLDGGAGSLGLSNGDLSAWLSDFFGGTYFQKDDYERSVSCPSPSSVGNGDLAKWLAVFFAGSSSANDAPAIATCP